MSITYTPKNLREYFENIVDESPDVDFVYQLLTQSKDRLENLYKPLILEKSDASQVRSSGDTYLTMKNLPTDFKRMKKLYVGIVPYFEVPFAKRIDYRFSARNFYIDYKTLQGSVAALGICGSGGTDTITQVYQVKTDALNEANEDTAGVVLWPDEFQYLIPLDAAIHYQSGIDTDNVAAKQALANEVRFEKLLDSFIAWDHDLKLSTMGNALGYADDVEQGGSGAVDLGLM